MSVSGLINVGIVGLGWPRERHAEAMDASSLGIVYAACDVNTERLKAFANAFGPRRRALSEQFKPGGLTDGNCRCDLSFEPVG